MAKGTPTSSASAGGKVICLNKKARFNYIIEETFEAGIVLTGAEIKSVRQGGVSLTESYVYPDRGQLFLVNAHIKPYAFGDNTSYNPTRKRKLLMHKAEIERLAGRVEAKGYTLVAIKLYLKRGYAKIEVGLAKGKAAPDKRKTIKDREGNREVERAMKMRNR